MKSKDQAILKMFYYSCKKIKQYDWQRGFWTKTQEVDC